MPGRTRTGSTSTTSPRHTACSRCWPRWPPGIAPAAARAWTCRRWRPAAAVMGPMMLDYIVNGRGSVRPGNQVPGAVLSEVVRCRGDDQWLAVELEDAADWRALARLTGHEDLAEAADRTDEGGPNGLAWLPDETA